MKLFHVLTLLGVLLFMMPTSTTAQNNIPDSVLQKVLKAAEERNLFKQDLADERQRNELLVKRIEAKEAIILAQESKITTFESQLLNRDQQIKNEKQINLQLTADLNSTRKALRKANNKVIVIGIAGIVLSFCTFIIGTQ